MSRPAPSTRLFVAMALSVFGLASAPHAAAQDGDKPKTTDWDLYATADVDKVKKRFVVDASVPPAPALTLLGTTASATIGAPYAPDFSTDVIASDGGTPTLALAARPYWLWGPGKDLTLSGGKGTPNYADKPWWEQAVARTSLSLAGGPKGTDAKSPIGLAFGVETAVIGYDPRLDNEYGKCLTSAMTVPPGSPPPGRYPLTSQPVAAAAAGSTVLTDEQMDRLRGGAEIFLEGAVRTQSAEARGAASVRIARVKAAPKATFDAVFKDEYAKIEPGADVDGVLAAMRKAALDDAEPKAPPVPKPAPEPQAVKLTAELLSGYAAKFTKCRSYADIRRANANSLTFGFGGVEISPKRRFSDLKYGGTDGWIAYTLPLGGSTKTCDPDPVLKRPKGDGDYCHKPFGQVTAFARYVWDDKVVKDKTTTLDSRTAIAGLSLSKTSDDGAWSVNFGYARYWRDYTLAGVKDENFDRISAGVAWKVTDSLGVAVSGGTVTHHPLGEGDFGLVRLTLATSTAK